MVAETDGWCFCIYGIIFNIIYNKNSPTSSGSEMNCKRNLNGSGGRREIGIPH